MGPVLSDFGYHIIMVKDIRPEKGKSLAEATPEIEGELKKTKGRARICADVESSPMRRMNNPRQPGRRSQGSRLKIKQSPWMSKSGGIRRSTT